ncbi:MAG: phosphoribosylamine--glycine ligase [Ruminiclostridium sp.]|nr:phosphoribosylamine--glycine ligase [Ruminiclostridium sp.]
MDILVVGGGGREHAILTALKKSPRVGKLYAAPGNGGISALAECFDVKATDLDGILALAERLNPDYVFVAPDDPLVMGLVDRLNEAGFATFGPRANAAILEGSKVFSKALMKKYGIPTAAYETFTDADKAITYLKEQNRYPAVIKCDGLALGKGVIIAADEAEAVAAVNSMLIDGKFGKSGNEIVIEEFMTGPEVTVLAFTDGVSVKPMVSSMDHKRALDGDKGLNTGGMGTIAPNPLYTPAIAEECMNNIFLPTIRAMAKEGRPFKGCLYFGLMLTPNGARVVEYNCRFGDPEAQVVLPLLKTDLTEIMDAIREERLGALDIEWDSGACACVVLASGGYPEKYAGGYPIVGLDENGQFSDGSATIYHAGTKHENGTYVTAGGRVLGVTAAAENLPVALEKAYRAAERVTFEKVHFRKDIGRRAVSGGSVSGT